MGAWLGRNLAKTRWRPYILELVGFNKYRRGLCWGKLEAYLSALSFGLLVRP